MNHKVKCYSDFFEPILAGNLCFWHQRPFDESYKVGDLIEFEEFDLESRGYTGRCLCRWITYIVSCGENGVAGSYSVWSLGVS